MEPQNKPQDPLSSAPPPAPYSPTQTPPASPPTTTQGISDILNPVDPVGTSDGYVEPSALQSIANGFRTIIVATLSWVVFPFAIVLVLHNFVFQAYHVLGTSMVPTLHETDYLIVSKLSDTAAMVQSTFGKKTDYIPARGKIIVFHYPQDVSKVFVKRVVGLPGDRVVIKNGTVSIVNETNKNGFNPDTSYELSSTNTLIDTDETVQPGNVFVLGDNRTPGGSFDSREWGQLPSSYIIGDAVLRLLPLKDTKVF